MLVIDVAYDLLYYVFERDKTRSPTVLIDNDRYVSPLCLHLPEKDCSFQSLRNICDRLDYLFGLLDGLNVVVVKILLVDDSDDIVQVILIDREPRQSGLPEDLLDLSHRGTSFDRHDVDSRRQNVDSLDVVEFDRIGDKLTLLFAYGSASLSLFDDSQKLILGKLRLVIPSESLF